MKRTLTQIATGAVLLMAALAARSAETPAAPAAPVFARIGDQVITQDDYDAAFAAAARSKFYHGKPPEGELAALQRTVGQQLVDRKLLLREAGLRQLHPDSAAIDKTVQGYEQRYANSAQWKQNRAAALPPLVARLEQDDLLAQLERNVRTGVAVSAQQVQAYYAANPAKFTEPEQLHVAVILMKVDPSSPTALWQETEAKVQALVARVRKGEDFAALARQFSNDDSAAKGGDMGYLHLGMLPEGTQLVLAPMQAGQTSDALRLLQGPAAFRLIDRKPARLLPLESVAVRARELAERDLGAQAWQEFLASLRLRSPAQLDTSRYLPLSEQAGARPLAQ
jgi:parvulin-like peptidyl-prolyl isomerase